ncbi:sugar ABC transporter ATP-binding protein [Arthrobacter ramosus]|uniref:Sugar ABC transporter ATP-binding protein n=1 Tax=Arthrobacter ramosus TaxID=1672 RepID=A0ABV5Y4K1_ARTRM|nr:sugar ABC transporter ATP-binding protein [Arthrobacter ramosus]
MTLVSEEKAERFGPGRPFALEVSDVTKVYGGEVALGGVSLTVAPGEIHGLLGANGAGKSTLVRLTCGAESTDGGEISICGQRLPKSTASAAAAARALGLSYIHQDRALAGDMSIADNISLTAGFPKTRLGLIRDGVSERRARSALDRVGIDLDPRQLVNELTIAEQTMVAIARALAVDAKVVLLDEPTANLGKHESTMLYARLRRLAKDGVAMVLITHAIDEALEHCDRITVLRNGLVAGSAPSNELSARELIGMIVGDGTPSEGVRGNVKPSGAVRLRATGVRTERLGPIDTDVRAGEILGITGMADSGHLTLGELLFGQLELESGSLEVDGEDFIPTTPAAAMRRGIGYVPGDRIRDGLATDLTAQENLFLDRPYRPTNPGARGAAAERREAMRILTEAAVKPRDPSAAIDTLSGGNMQKVLIARWLAKQPSLLVLSEPTIGVDVGARNEIYDRIYAEAERGVGVVVTSSDFEEIALVCDRALVLRYGRVVGELSGDALTIQALTDMSSSS